MNSPRGATEGAPSKGDQQRSNERKSGTDAAAGRPGRILTDGGKDPDTPLELRYAVSTDVDPVDLLPQGVVGSVEEYADLDADGAEFTVTVADGRMCVEREAGDGLGVVFDPSAPELVLLHRAESAYARIERPLDDLEPSVEPLEVESAGLKREFQVGQQCRTARRFDATIDGRRLELWTVRVPERAQSFSRTLWRRLLPGAPKHLYRAGFPAEMTIRDPTDAQRSLVHVRLVDWREDPELSIPPAPPDSYDELEPREQPYSTANPPEEGPGDVERLFRERESDGPPGPVSSMRTRHALRRGGQDFAAALDQAVLDEVSSGINAVTETFGEFGPGDGGEIDLEIDWFQQLRPHLEFRTSEGEEITEEVLDVLASLLLFKEVTTISPDAPVEEFPPGLTDVEQTRFRQALRDAEPDRDPAGFHHPDRLGLDEPEARLAYFRLSFSADRQVELADRYFESLTRPIEQDLHPGDITEDGVVYFELWDFDATLRVGHRPVVDALEFEDYHVRLDLQFDELSLEFDFLTAPGTDWKSVAVNFLTLGIFGAAFQANRGWGLVEYEDVHVVVYLTPWPESFTLDYIGMDVTVDEDASDADGFLFLNGINFSASVVDLIYAGIASRLNESLLTDRFYGAIEEGLRGAVREDLSEFLHWPNFWPGFWDPDSDRPLGVGSAALVDPGSAIFEGDLIGRSPSMAREVDTPDTEALDYVLAERYLEEWLRERLPVMIDGETHRDPAPFADGFGVSLPDPRSLPGADDPVDFEERPMPEGIRCPPPPPEPGPEFENRLVIERRLPSVDLPEAGERDRAGILHSRYRLRVEAVRRDYEARHRIVEEPCPPSGEDEEPGPAPIPLSPQGWASRERAIALARAGQPAFGGFAGGGFRGGGFAGGGFRGGGIGPGFRGGRLGSGEAFHDHGADDADGAGPPCPTRYCEWEVESAEKTLETYLDATVRVTGDLFVGFAADGSDIWLPELALYLAEDSDGNPDVDGEVLDLSVAGPFADPDRDDVESALARTAVEDALVLLEEMPNPNPPETTHRLVPTEEAGIFFVLDAIFLDREIDSDFWDDIRDVLGELVTYEQTGGTESLQYTVDGGLLYWPIEAEQNISEHIS